MAACMGKSESLNDNDGDPCQDVFYIDEVEATEEYRQDDLVLMERILKELPYLTKCSMHQTTQSIVYYLAPTKRDWYEEPQNRRAVSHLLMEKAAPKFGGILQHHTGGGTKGRGCRRGRKGQ